MFGIFATILQLYMESSINAADRPHSARCALLKVVELMKQTVCNMISHHTATEKVNKPEMVHSMFTAAWLGDNDGGRVSCFRWRRHGVENNGQRSSHMRQ